MKKICYITTVSITIKAFILSQIEFLHRNTDWDFSVICSPGEGFAEMLPDYIHYYPVVMKRGVSIAGIKATWGIQRILIREKFDLIQYSTPNASFYAALAGTVARVPIRLYCQWGMAFKGFSGYKRYVFKSLEKLICALSTYIEPDSKSNLEFAISEKLYKGNKAGVVWNGSACGIDLKKFDPESNLGKKAAIRERYGISDSSFVFIFVGRVTRDKGVNELFSAFKAIADERDVHLLMVGPNEVNNSVDAAAYEWTLQTSKVTYTGFTDKVEQYLSAADCYVLPSYHEGFGMSIIEAEAMGLPVIVTDIPGPSDAMIDGRTGIKIQKQNVSELSEAMVFLYDHPDKVKEFGEAGRQFVVSNFDQQRLFRYILSDRERLLSRSIQK